MKNIKKMTTDYFKVLEILYDNQVTINDETFSPITQVEISKMLGLSVITINALFKELKQDEMVLQDGKKARKYILSSEAQEAVQVLKTLENK